jgi:hypothetical protein
LSFAAKITKQRTAMPNEERQLAAIVFTDMLGYNTLEEHPTSLSSCGASDSHSKTVI